MSYSVTVTPQAEEDLRKLDRLVRRRVVGKIRWVASHVGEIRHEALSARFAGTFKLRVGAYRVIYALEHEEKRVIIHGARHRREVYRR